MNEFVPHKIDGLEENHLQLDHSGILGIWLSLDVNSVHKKDKVLSCYFILLGSTNWS